MAPVAAQHAEVHLRLLDHGMLVVACSVLATRTDAHGSVYDLNSTKLGQRSQCRLLP